MATFDRKDDYLYVRWAQAVKKRDHYTCQVCGSQGKELNSHHLNAWASYPEERYDVDNGITLCSGTVSSCHERFHQIYGKGNNTREQFDEFHKIYEIIYKNCSKRYNIEKIRDALISKLDGYF